MSLNLNLSTNARDVAQRIADLGKQGRFAAAVALTQTAKKDVQPGIRREMQRTFDRPTSYTLNSTFLKPATKVDLEARVWLKDRSAAGKGTPADRYLAPQIYGGQRHQKGMERLLQMGGLMPAGWVAVPAAGAQLDGNGNVKRSQIVQILSQLKLQRGAGFESRASGSGRSNRTIAKQGVTYFALPVARRGLAPGIYLKRKAGRGKSILPVFVFAAKATYRPILKFFEVGEQIARSAFPGHFEEQIAKAIATARL
jgi:hypothetical protein